MSLSLDECSLIPTSCYSSPLLPIDCPHDPATAECFVITFQPENLNSSTPPVEKHLHRASTRFVLLHFEVLLKPRREALCLGALPQDLQGYVTSPLLPCDL
ncbi:unnamed protein product [Pleuronectes platessa]|uniref:Uncharacterized protein n=1 Tax=Pleuronectes platessa TaxID=8262 RepID=A0A9N7Z471_PLEPL|nr:unnamed protein product [Pleuronectes platessa]